jgi:hypothetical protein
LYGAFGSLDTVEGSTGCSSAAAVAEHELGVAGLRHSCSKPMT